MEEQFINEYKSELLHMRFTPEEVVRALRALSVTMHGYRLVSKESNIVPYDPVEVTAKLIKLYVDCKAVEGCSRGFCENLGRILPKLYEYAGKGVKEVSSFDVRGFLAYWQAERKITCASLNKYRQYIHQFYVWLMEEGYIDHNPCATIKTVRAEKKERDSLTPLELEEIRSHLTSKREKVLIEFLYSTGCRATELCGVKLSDLDLENGRVQLFGKGKKYRTGYLNARAIVAIKEYLAERKDDGVYLYGSIRYPYDKVTYHTIENDIARIGERVNDKISHDLHPHLFRHTTATLALHHGLPIEEVQQLLGHASISTTMLYLKMDKDRLQHDHAKYVI